MSSCARLEEVKFSIDPNNKAVQCACSYLLKGSQLQVRHMFKKDYFDDVLANQERTTSQLKHETKDKYRDSPPTAIDHFRDLHCRSKTDLSDPIKEAIDQMEAIVAEPTEGQDPKTAIEAVAEVLPSSKLQKCHIYKPHLQTVQELEAEV
ncbi:unnamed protein product [Urochloa decumbens]|uniref:Uncharacterized protein n=1 Tax=Urochloa decumbens TaxID=240449 RepID=A0ABC9B182_9POAL